MNKLLRKSELFLKRNSSTILTCVGAIGVIATSVMAVKATPKAMMKLEEAKKEKGDELTTSEKIVVAGPTYIPSIVAGVSTIACIFGANILNKRQQAALMSAYALLDNSYKDYKKKTQELYGEDADIRIRNEIAKDKCKENDLELGDDKLLFFDDYSGRYFESTMENVVKAEYELNRKISLWGGAYLNEFYEFLGLEPTDFGDAVGWDICSELFWIDFDHRKTMINIGDADDKIECYIIETPYPPCVDYISQSN